MIKLIPLWSRWPFWRLYYSTTQSCAEIAIVNIYGKFFRSVPDIQLRAGNIHWHYYRSAGRKTQLICIFFYYCDRRSNHPFGTGIDVCLDRAYTYANTNSSRSFVIAFIRSVNAYPSPLSAQPCHLPAASVSLLSQSTRLWTCQIHQMVYLCIPARC